MQAVYFSGASMAKEFKMIREWNKTELHFPGAIRRPDYRSSGPKRLMPQLQIKVPTLRRWGKKMAVLVDIGFFESMGEMADVPDISNCDVAWFVVNYTETAGSIKITPALVKMTTLENAVDGLTAGKPVTLTAFEQRIREKINR
jgi:hypothetical protein